MPTLADASASVQRALAAAGRGLVERDALLELVVLAAVANVALRLGDDTLTLADDRGRVLTVELRHGAIERQLRIL